MKTLLIAGLVVLASCASKPHQKLAVSSDSSLFKGESLWRVSGSKEVEGSWLKDCYDGDLTGFTQKAREAYGKGSKTARYWTWVGNCLAWHDELREARFFLGMASELAKGKEETAMVKNNLALVYLRSGKVSKAFDLLQESIALAPHFVTPSFNLAQLYVSQNMNQDALKILSSGQFDKNTDPEVLHLKGLAYIQGQQVKVAGTYLSQIPPKMHKREDIALTLAQWHMLEGRPSVAVDLIENLNASGAVPQKQLAERLLREAEQRVAALEKK